MASVCLSCSFKKNLFSLILTTNGKVESKRVDYIKDSEFLESPLMTLIYVFDIGLNMLRMYIEEHPDTESAVFECNNTTFIKWIQQGYSRDEYLVSFSKVLEHLNEIPVMYSMSYSKKPKAYMFLDEKYIKKEKLVGLLD